MSSIYSPTIVYDPSADSTQGAGVTTGENLTMIDPGWDMYINYDSTKGTFDAYYYSGTIYTVNSDNSVTKTPRVYNPLNLVTGIPSTIQATVEPPDSSSSGFDALSVNPASIPLSIDITAVAALYTINSITFTSRWHYDPSQASYSRYITPPTAVYEVQSGTGAITPSNPTSPPPPPPPPPPVPPTVPPSPPAVPPTPPAPPIPPTPPVPPTIINMPSGGAGAGHAVARLTVAGKVTLNKGGACIRPYLTAGNYKSPALKTKVTLGAGDNTVNVPQGTVAVAVCLPQGAGATLKGAAGDTGIQLASGGWSVLQPTVSSATTQFILNTAAAHTQATSLLFF